LLEGGADCLRPSRFVYRTAKRIIAVSGISAINQKAHRPVSLRLVHISLGFQIGTQSLRRSAPGDGGPEAEFRRRPEAAPGSAVPTQHFFRK